MRVRTLLLGTVLSCLAFGASGQVGGLYWLCNPPSGYCPVSNSYPLPTTGTTGSGAGTPADKGGTLTTGGTSQPSAPSNPNRKFVVVMNPCTAAGENLASAEDLYVSITGSATVGGSGNFADLAPCGSATVSVSASVSVNAATTGHRWYATEVQ